MESKIDWSKAPEWATHALEKLHEPDRNLVYWSFFVDGEHRVEPNGLWYHPDGYRIIQSRPTNQSWYGEGLPPVGVVCEVKLQEEWILCEIIAHFQQPQAMVAAFTVAQFHGGKKLDSKIAECFRPIRTPEQIAADEREAAINDLENLICAFASHRDAAIHIYDVEGYRKP